MMTMRKHMCSIQYAAIFSLPLLLGGCSESIGLQAGNGDLGGQPITLNIGAASSDAGAWSGGAWAGGAWAGAATRIATGDGHGEDGTEFYQGEQFTAHFTAGSTVESAVYTIQSGATTAKAVSGSPAGNREPYFQPGATSATVRGYFPAVRPLKPTTWTVRTDQETNDGFRLSDLMYAPEQTVTATASALTFEHRMARVRILINNSGFTNTGAYIVGGACRTVNIADPETLTPGVTLSDPVADTDAGRIAVWTGSASNDEWNATCLLPPQVLCQQTTVGTPVAFLRLSYSGGNITFTMDPSRLESGKTYYIKINRVESWMMGQTLHLGAIGSNGTVEWAPPTASTIQQSSPGLYQVDGVTFRMQRVNAGTSAANSAATYSGPDFWIGETEVTTALWRSVMSSLPSGASAVANHPVNHISWNDITKADGFLVKLNTLTDGQRPDGYVFTLPTQQQWRFAARGGIHSKGYTYSGTNNDADCVRYDAGGYEAVASKNVTNELGLYDMSGNLWEYCLDRDANNRIPILGGGSTGGTEPMKPGYGEGHAATSDTDTQWRKYDTETEHRGFRLALVLVPPVVGDLYFSDGTYGTLAEYPAKTPIGIVVSTDMSATDRAAGYTHGYVMALGSSAKSWAKTTLRSVGYSSTIPCNLPASMFKPAISSYTPPSVTASNALTDANWGQVTADMDGRTHTADMKAENGRVSWDYTSVEYVEEYANTVTPPSGASSWFIPSIGQLSALFTNLLGCTLSRGSSSEITVTGDPYTAWTTLKSDKGITAFSLNSTIWTSTAGDIYKPYSDDWYTIRPWQWYRGAFKWNDWDYTALQVIPFLAF